MKNAILITGAGQRIGLALAKHYLGQGYEVIFSYRSHKAGVDELGALGALGFQVDFNQDDQVAGFIRSVLHQCVSLRAVIHNASAWLTDQQVIQEADGFSQLFKIHMQVPMQLSLAFAPLLRKSNSPLKDIITLSDDKIHYGSDKHMAYVASKAGLSSLSQSLAKSLAPEIKVNDIAPALIQFNDHDSEDYKKNRLAQSALGIEPGAQVICQTVDYILNNPYLTGQQLRLEGGRSLMK